MRAIVHLADLHFGRTNQALTTLLTAAVNEIHPGLLIVFGDLTQRAHAAKFKQARMFLEILPMLQIIVPGNHDVPHHNVFARFLQLLENYRRYINFDVEPFFLDDEGGVRGVNTARSSTIKNGRINAEQIEHVRARFSRQSSQIIKLVMSHRPYCVHALPNSVIKLFTCVLINPKVTHASFRILATPLQRKTNHAFYRTASATIFFRQPR